VSIRRASEIKSQYWQFQFYEAIFLQEVNDLLFHARHSGVGSDIAKVHLIEDPDPNGRMSL
jgi:hypothetical protein